MLFADLVCITFKVVQLSVVNIAHDIIVYISFQLCNPEIIIVEIQTLYIEHHFMKLALLLEI